MHLKTSLLITLCLCSIIIFSACNNSEENNFTDGDLDGENESEITGNLQMTILHTNDTHSHVLEFNKYGSDCSSEDSAAGLCFGGVARRQTLIDQTRLEHQNVLLLDAGDQFQGSLFFTYFKGEVTSYFMNQMKYDAMALGNHEFDVGSQLLAAFIDEINFPLLSCNVDTSNNQFLAEKLLPYTILDVAQRKVAVVGYITEETEFLAKVDDDIIFHDIETELPKTIAEIRSKGIDIIIALSHSGLSKDEEIAQNIDGIDLIIGGHSHSLLSNTNEDSEDDYPLEYTSVSGEPVLVVTASYNGKYLGNLDLEFDSNGVLVSWAGDPVLLDASVKQDQQTLEKAMKFNEDLQPIYEEVIGQTDVALIGDSAVCRFAECNFGNLIADALLYEARLENTEIAFINSGSIRTGIDPGEITLAETLGALPFGNSLSTFSLKGKFIKEVLEHSVSRADNPDNEGTGRFLQVSGIRYNWDSSKDMGLRVSDIEIYVGEDIWEPIDDETEYKVTAPGFLRQGGDDYDMLATEAINPYDYGRRISDIVADYIEIHSPVAPVVEGRINRL